MGLTFEEFVVLSPYPMAGENLAIGQTAKICLFDLGNETLQKILANGDVCSLISKFEKDTFLEDVHTFLDLNDDGAMWVVREYDKENAEKEWTVELPIEITEAIKKITSEDSRYELLQS
jgi:hypothetical protein